MGANDGVELQKPAESNVSKPTATKEMAGGSEDGDHAEERKGDDWHYSHGLTSSGASPKSKLGNSQPHTPAGRAS
jgi:hypothetical protein